MPEIVWPDKLMGFLKSRISRWRRHDSPGKPWKSWRLPMDQNHNTAFGRYFVWRSILGGLDWGEAADALLPLGIFWVPWQGLKMHKNQDVYIYVYVSYLNFIDVCWWHCWEAICGTALSFFEVVSRSSSWHIFTKVCPRNGMLPWYHQKLKGPSSGQILQGTNGANWLPNLWLSL